MSILVGATHYDNFERADGSLHDRASSSGHFWAANTGRPFSIVAGNVGCQTSGSGPHITTINTGLANGIIQTTFSSGSNGANKGLVFRYATGLNYLYLTNSAIVKVVAGVVTQLVTGQQFFGTDVSVELSGVNIVVRRNGIAVAAIECSDHVAATRHGFRWENVRPVSSEYATEWSFAPTYFDPTAYNYINFTYTEDASGNGVEQLFVVPDDITELQVDLQGAGWAGRDAGGGRLIATLPVVPGETLRLRVGGQGTAAAGGYNGGGSPGGAEATGGHGASDIRRGGSALSDRIAVAGGAGGQGSLQLGAGGGGGGGGLPATRGSADTPRGGGPGTLSTGGVGGESSIVQGNPTVQATSGVLGSGGSGAFRSNDLGHHGGGGGGGFYGGGGGGAQSSDSSGGGGGGSNFIISEATNVVHTTGYRVETGLIALSFNGSLSGGGSNTWRLGRS